MEILEMDYVRPHVIKIFGLVMVQSLVLDVVQYVDKKVIYTA